MKKRDKGRLWWWLSILVAAIAVGLIGFYLGMERGYKEKEVAVKKTIQPKKEPAPPPRKIPKTPILKMEEVPAPAEKTETSEQIQMVLKTLTPKEEKVIRMRFGIGADRDHTLEEVGRHLSITRERVRQIEAKALRKLKHPSRLKALKKLTVTPT